MDTKLLFQDSAGFQTPMLAVFAVDIAIGKDADPLVALLTTSDAVTDAAAKVLASGEFKATLGETLLLHKSEVRKLEGMTKQKGFTLIPTRLYFRNGRVKCELALAKGKQEWDKRATERKREADNEAKAAVARSQRR